MTTRRLMMAAGVAGAVLGAASARAQLRADEVLLVYDSRLPDSLGVAEVYAGSARVPGGAGGVVGARPGVRVVDLAALGAPQSNDATITYAQFEAWLREPIRTYLVSQNLTQRVRCLVLTKGLPHRIEDHQDTPAAAPVGDDPPGMIAEIQASDATCASVDSELTLLYHDLDVNEAGGQADSRADGAMLNPYWRLGTPIRLYPQTNNQAAKTYITRLPGPVYLPSGSGASILLPGDIMLVVRLDGRSVPDIASSLARAGRVYYDTLAHIATFDESGANGVADGGPTDELDNAASLLSALRDADDYETTRNELQSDTRFAPTFARYNELLGSTQFFVGPRVAWQPTVITVVEPVALVTTYGSNHFGLPLTTGGEIARTIYASSYNYADGAIFNTLESYNGRDLGGTGQLSFAPQQQIADFIAAGGTFGVASVWEPLADSAPDSRYLARNFLRGNLSWAEAAWSAIPGLSWQQIAIGDPLARPLRSSEDITGDRRGTIDDLYAWEQTPADVDRNGTPNDADRGLVLQMLRSWERAEMLTGR
ncbi:MAG: hypothetical protein SFY69_09070 [Planctomycetota bacterium]|nr:hypothetical protein [Planctomycetota bacterium]